MISFLKRDLARNIDRLRRCDLDRCVEIDAVSFIEPWTKVGFILALEEPCTVGMVVRDARGCTEGYAVYRFENNDIRIARMAVREASRGTGVGSLILSRIRSLVGNERRSSITVHVPEHLWHGQEWFAKRGFVGWQNRECVTMRFE